MLRLHAIRHWAGQRVFPVGRFVVASLTAVANLLFVGQVVWLALQMGGERETPQELVVPEHVWRPRLLTSAARPPAPVPHQRNTSEAAQPAPPVPPAPPAPDLTEPPTAPHWQREITQQPGSTIHVLRLPSDFAWELEGTSRVEHHALEDAAPYRIELASLLPATTTALVPPQFDEVFAVGLASCVRLDHLDTVERYRLLREQEELAKDRARVLADAVSEWLRRHGRDELPVRTLNAGLDLGACSADDRHNRRQRGILLLAVNGGPASPGDLREALRQAGLAAYSRLQPH